MLLPLKIALRYLFSRKNQKHFGFLTLLALGGIFISVMGYLVVDGVLSGFSKHIRKALVGFDANLTIPLGEGVNQNDLEAILAQAKDISFSQKVIELEALVYSGQKLLGTLQLRGIDFDLKPNQPSVKFYDFEEASSSLDRLYFGEQFFSRSMMDPFKVAPIRLLNPFGDIGPTGDFVPQQAELGLGGFFTTGHYDFDASYAFVPTSIAKKLCGIDCRQSLLVYYHEGVFSSPLETQLKQKGIVFETWKQKNKRRYSALQLERLGLGFLLTLVLLIASINIFSLVSLISFKKMREGVLLWVLGFNRSQLTRVYLYYAATLGFLGALPGVLAGLGILIYLKANPLPLPPAYYLESLPTEIKWQAAVFLLIMAPVIAMLTALWPALKTSRRLPVEALREVRA